MCVVSKEEWSTQAVNVAAIAINANGVVRRYVSNPELTTLVYEAIYYVPRPLYLLKKKPVGIPGANAPHGDKEARSEQI